jgi:hypothetical protein
MNNSKTIAVIYINNIVLYIDENLDDKYKYALYNYDKFITAFNSYNDAFKFIFNKYV